MATAAPPEPTGGVIRMPTPREGSRQVSETPDGRAIYEYTVTEPLRDEAGKIVREPVLGSNGKPVWEKDMRTGVERYQRMKNVMVTRKKRYILHVEQNERGKATGDIREVEYTDTMHARLTQAQNERNTDDFRDQIFEEARRRGLSPTQVVDRLLGVEEEPEKEQQLTAPPPPGYGNEQNRETFPEMYGPGLWYLTALHKQRVKASVDKGFKGTRADAETERDRLVSEGG